MPAMTDASFEDLVEQALEQRPPEGISASISMPGLPPEAQGFIMRMLVLMKRAKYSAADFNPPFIRWLSHIQNVLPGAWGGMVPPITMPGRHGKLDDYVAGKDWPSGKNPPVFVDIGCGFPPVTTSDTAAKLADWRIFGVDRSFADYVVYDTEGNYACFDQKGEFLYFQSFMSNAGRIMYTDPEAARHHFNTLFSDLLPLLENANDGAGETVEKDKNRLIHHHIRDFETDNLAFIKSDIGKLKGIQPAQVIRCMNVFVYFDSETRNQMLQQAAGLLDDAGILIAGTNGLSIQSRYTVYQKHAHGISPVEFAFSPDNLGPITFMPWFTIHENDPEAMLLAELSGVIRSHPSFGPAFGNRVDELLQRQSICKRGSDDFLHFEYEEMTPREYIGKNAMVWRQMEKEGYVDGAVDVLDQAGYEAWKNPVGDIAVRPPADALP